MKSEIFDELFEKFCFSDDMLNLFDDTYDVSNNYDLEDDESSAEYYNDVKTFVLQMIADKIK